MCCCVFSSAFITCKRVLPIVEILLTEVYVKGKPAYAKLLMHYNRTLSQRNMLLKEITKHPELKIHLKFGMKSL